LRHRAVQFGVLILAIAVGIAWAPDAFLRNILKTLPVLRKQGSISSRCFVPPNNDIAIAGAKDAQRERLEFLVYPQATRQAAVTGAVW